MGIKLLAEGTSLRVAPAGFSLKMDFVTQNRNNIFNKKTAAPANVLSISVLNIPINHLSQLRIE